VSVRALVGMPVQDGRTKQSAAVTNGVMMHPMAEARNGVGGSDHKILPLPDGP
jgi:hypothetical protein